jgi:hypothetical protein
LYLAAIEVRPPGAEARDILDAYAALKRRSSTVLYTFGVEGSQARLEVAPFKSGIVGTNVVDGYFCRVYFGGYMGFPDWHYFLDSDCGG